MREPLAERSRARLWLAVQLAVAAALIAGFALLLRGLDGRALLAALRRANLGMVGAAAATSFALMGWKAVRLRVLLAPTARVPVLRLWRYTVLGSAATTLLPARAGGAVRVWLLMRREGVPGATAVTVSATEKIYDALSMLAVVGPIPWLMPGLPVWVVRAIALVAAFGVAALVGAWILLYLGGRGGGAGRLARWLPGLETLRRPRELAAATALSLLMWATDLAALELVLLALGIHLPPGGPMLVLLAINLAITMPAAPAHLGTFELGALLSLEICGVDRAPALAFALLYHAMQAIPLALIGLVEIRFLLSTLRRDAAPPGPGA